MDMIPLLGLAASLVSRYADRGLNGGGVFPVGGAGGTIARRARTPSSKTRELEGRVNQLTLVCMAMWSILKEKAGVTEKELLARVEQIDLADGKADGKMTVRIVKCTACGRTLGRRHRKCLYCGAPRVGSTAFDGTVS